MSNQEAKYRHLIENIQDAVVEFEFVEGEPIVRDVNDAFVDTFGYSRAEIRGESLNARIIPDGEYENARDIDRRTESGETTSHQLTRQTASGPREFIHRCVPYDDSGDIDGIAVYTDITERKRAEQKRQLLTETSRCLGEAETLREGFETTLEVICGYTEWACGEVWRPAPESGELRLTVGYTDDPACDTFLAESEDVTFSFGDGLPGRVYDSKATEWLADVSKADADVFHRTDLAASIGLRAGFGAPVVADGTVVAVVVFFLRDGCATDEVLVDDVTNVAQNLGELVARKQAEELIKRRNVQLEEFADVISHDLRSPLNVAMGHLEMAADDCDSSHVAKVAAAHERMGQLIADILTLARQGKSVEAAERFQLAECVVQSWGMTGTPDADLRVETDRPVWGDASRVRQLLENLFRNAIDHGPDDVTVTVGDFEGGFFVADDGPGIDVDDAETVFEMGYTTHAGGTGLGLPIVEEIADAHGWSITVTESAAGGARFEFVGVESGQ